MDDHRIKGDVFIGVLKLVASKWGRVGLESIGTGPEEYALEQWYPYSDFCDLLMKVRKQLAQGNPMIIYQIGFNMVKIDRRWQEIFGAMNPGDVFTTTKRQESQYRVGTYSAEPVGPKHIRVTLLCNECRHEWCEFYRGRLQGVLELTGRTGVVHLQPPKEKDGARIFDIKWG